MSTISKKKKMIVLWLSGANKEAEQDILGSCVDAELSIHPQPPISLEESDWQRVTVMVVNHLHTITAELLQQCPQLRVVVRLGIGVDNIDQGAASQLGVCVCNVPDYGIEEVADMAVGQILALFRQTTFLYEAVVKGEPFQTLEQFVAKARASRRIRGKTLGLLGLGNIGVAVCYRAKVFGFQVIFFDPYVRPGVAKSLGGVEQVYSVDELILRSDCISIHCPSTAETRGIISEEKLKLFKRDAFLVNTARGDLIDEGALAAALTEGRIAGAALDVYCQEPFTLKGSVFEGVPNLILTPHSAWYSLESQKEMVASACKMVKYALTHKGDPSTAGLTSCLNQSVLDKDACKNRWK